MRFYNKTYLAQFTLLPESHPIWKAVWILISRYRYWVSTVPPVWKCVSAHKTLSSATCCQCNITDHTIPEPIRYWYDSLRFFVHWYILSVLWIRIRIHLAFSVLWIRIRIHLAVLGQYSYWEYGSRFQIQEHGNWPNKQINLVSCFQKGFMYLRRYVFSAYFSCKNSSSCDFEVRSGSGSAWFRIGFAEIKVYPDPHRNQPMRIHNILPC